MENATDTLQPTAPRLRFRRCDRVILRRDFARTFEARCTTSNDWIVVYAVENGLAWSRLGISVSRRVGNAVMRNYIKRRIREAFRTRRAEIPIGYDLIVVAKAAASARSAPLAQAVVGLSGEVVVRLSRRIRARKPGSPPTQPPS